MIILKAHTVLCVLKRDILWTPQLVSVCQKKVIIIVAQSKLKSIEIYCFIFIVQKKRAPSIKSNYFKQKNHKDCCFKARANLIVLLIRLYIFCLCVSLYTTANNSNNTNI